MHEEKSGAEIFFVDKVKISMISTIQLVAEGVYE